MPSYMLSMLMYVFDFSHNTFCLHLLVNDNDKFGEHSNHKSFYRS